MIKKIQTLCLISILVMSSIGHINGASIKDKDTVDFFFHIQHQGSVSARVSYTAWGDYTFKNVFCIANSVWMGIYYKTTKDKIKWIYTPSHTITVGWKDYNYGFKKSKIMGEDNKEPGVFYIYSHEAAESPRHEWRINTTKVNNERIPVIFYGLSTTYNFGIGINSKVYQYDSNAVNSGVTTHWLPEGNITHTTWLESD